MFTECDELKWLPGVSTQSRLVFSLAALKSFFHAPYQLFGVWLVFRLRPQWSLGQKALLYQLTSQNPG